jgi:TonB family protein
MCIVPLTNRRRWACSLMGGIAWMCIALVGDAAAQSSMGIVGIVTDSVLGIGISGAEVSWEGTALRTLTDEAGAFHLTGASAGRGSLRVRRLGFLTRSIVVAAGQEGGPITVRLVPSIQPLAPVQVRAARTKYSGRLAGYYERLERRTQGQFITRADLDRDRPTQLTDMLQRSPGISITRGRPGAQSVRMRGRDCRPLVWLDGAPMSAGDVDLDSFSPTSLEGIEMYLGGANAPPRYQAARGQSECGTILLWSRGPDTEPRRVARGVRPDELEEMIASMSIFTSDQVEVPASLDPGEPWDIPYPPSLRASGISGLVIAEFVVDTLGRVEVPNFGIVSSSHPLFSDAVREAVQDAQFRPALRKGQRVRELVRQPFVFHPPKEAPPRREQEDVREK